MHLSYGSWSYWLLNRRGFLEGACIATLIACVPALAHTHGATKPDDTIAVSSLTPGNFAANAFTGFNSIASTVALSGVNFLKPNPDVASPFLATTIYTPRDVQVSTYTARGSIVLRMSGKQGQESCLYFDYNGAMTGGDIRVGIKTGFDSSLPYESSGGTNYAYYVNGNVAASPEGIAAGFTNSYTNGDLFTFGVQGFTVFLQWNGIDLIRYAEWRLMNSGKCAIWTHAANGVRDITVHYPTQTTLFSDTATQTYDPRDFGMRVVAATTGSMSLGSNQITGVTSGSFQVGDQVIVCIGGEAGAGARGTKGVGGTWPTLSYANTTAMNADTSQVSGTFAYDASSSPLAAYVWNGSSWSHTQGGGGGGVGAQSYYTYYAIPLPLVAKVTAVSGTTVTLDTTASNATTNADIRLDCLPSFYVLNQSPPLTATMAPGTPNITLSIPSSQGTADQSWYLSGPVTPSTSVVVTPPSGVTIKGASRTLTTMKSPKSSTTAMFSFSPAVNNFTISDMKCVGNNGANGYGFNHGVNTFTSPYGVTISLASSSGATGIIVKNVDVVDAVGQAISIAGTSPLIDNCTTTMSSAQMDYMGWQIQITNSSGGTIQNCTATGAFLLKAFEVFACNGTKITNCGGTNPIYSTNSSTSWTIDCRGLTINYAANSFTNQLSGAIDEGIIQATSNAFGTGGSGIIYLGRHIQQGYIDASNNSLKFIQNSSAQPNLTIIGAYPGAGGCSTSLDGLLQAPNYDAGSAEYGAMAVYSDGAGASITGIRIKGTAIGSPGHSGHFGNISALGSGSSVTNCVADVIQTGPTLSGNQTNAAYGGC